MAGYLIAEKKIWSLCPMSYPSQTAPISRAGLGRRRGPREDWDQWEPCGAGQMPTVYTDPELTFVRDEDAPGVTSYREKLSTLFNGHEVHAIARETIIGKLDEVAGKFHVLLIKSNMRIPYTSVFFELGCGYWSVQAEERLRAAMTSADRRQNGSKRGDGNSSRVLRGKVHR
jgi:hypothetical protein